MTLICSVLNCPTTYDRTKTLFNDAFERYQMYKILSSGEKIETENGVAMVKTDVFYPLLTEEIPLLEREIVPVHTPFSPKNEKIIAQIKIRLANHLIFSGNLYKL